MGSISSSVSAKQDDNPKYYHQEHVQYLLKEMGEKPLKDGGRGHVYRLIVMPSMGLSYLYRLNVRRNNSSKVRYKGFGNLVEGDDQDISIVKKSQSLNKKETAELLEIINAIDFESNPSILPLFRPYVLKNERTGKSEEFGEICMDGTTYKLEVLIKGKYKSIQHGCLFNILEDTAKAFSKYKN